MTEHNYTDEEVIKALDHCRNGERGSKCSKCEYATGCKHWLIGLALDLINRQKAEISALTSAVDNSTKVFLNLHDEYKVQKEMIERLTKAIEVQEIMLENHDRKIKATKVEAIKEFAEKLKSIYINDKRYDRPNAHTMIIKLFANIDDLVKEFTEEKT